MPERLQRESAVSVAVAAGTVAPKVAVVACTLCVAAASGVAALLPVCRVLFDAALHRLLLRGEGGGGGGF